MPGEKVDPRNLHASADCVLVFGQWVVAVNVLTLVTKSLNPGPDDAEAKFVEWSNTRKPKISTCGTSYVCKA